jgi:hypothetical protein
LANRDVRFTPKSGHLQCRHHGGSSLVSGTESALIAGAAKTTTGNIAIHATSPDNSQCLKNPTTVGDGKLAMPAAIKLVSPA